MLCNVSGFGEVVYLRTGSNGFKLKMRNERVTDVHSRRRYDLKYGYFTFLLRRLGRMYLSQASCIAIGFTRSTNLIIVRKWLVSKQTVLPC